MFHNPLLRDLQIVAMSPRFWKLFANFSFHYYKFPSFFGGGVLLSICISHSRLDYAVVINKQQSCSGLIQWRFLSSSCSVRCIYSWSVGFPEQFSSKQFTHLRVYRLLTLCSSATFLAIGMERKDSDRLWRMLNGQFWKWCTSFWPIPAARIQSHGGGR